MPHDPNDAAYLWDMLRYARTVERLVVGRSMQDYAKDEVLRLAVERAVEIIGEACRGVSKGLRDQHPEVPWRQIEAQRHILTHDYAAIVDEKVWRVATVHVPALIALLEPLVPPPPPTT